jgi:hypothetical protein
MFTKKVDAMVMVAVKNEKMTGLVERLDFVIGEHVKVMPI